MYKEGTIMKLSIEEQMLFSTVRIESLDESDRVIGIGTGFFLNKKLEDDKYKVFLVSNKHVLFTTDKIRISICKSKDDLATEPNIGNFITIPISNIRKITNIHSDNRIDIAVIDITRLFILISEKKLFFKSISYDMLATFEEEELNIAQNIMFIGYPDNRYDIVNNLPIIRNGLIASHPKYDYNGAKIFIIDGQVFPGSSGSPVMINLTVESWKTGSITIGPQKIRFLGIVAATMIRNNRLEVIDTSTVPDITVEEVIGLGIVYKATALKEIVDSILNKDFSPENTFYELEALLKVMGKS